MKEYRPGAKQPTDAHSALHVNGELIHLMAEWRLLTQREGAAIQREDWPAVAEEQGSKKRLSEEMTRVQERLQPKLPLSQTGPSEEERRFRELLAEVVALEHRNSEVLSAKRQCRREELERLSQATHHLQGVRRAYGTSSQHWWQSYS